MKFIKLNFWLLLVALFSIFLFPLLANEVWAADLNIDCPAPPTTCSKSGLDPLFSNIEDGYWYPGRSLTKTINLKNSSPEQREMAIRGERTSSVNILENVMQISIVGGTTVIWGGSVADFYGQDKIGMGIFDLGADFDYDFTVSMSSAADDNYQNRETVFDLTLGFWGEPIPIPTPTTTGTPAPTPTPTPGTVLGAGVSAPVCTDTKPELPTNFAAVGEPGVGQVTLSWTPPAPPYTYFLIAYSDDPDSPKWGNPNIDAGAVSYTVSGLGSGTYWFWLRAGNGCMPGDFVKSEPVTIGGIPGAGLAPGFEVLGEKTPGELGEAGATEGAEIGKVEGEKAKSICWWWLILSLLELIILSAYYWLTQEKENIRKYWPIISFVLAIFAFIGDHFIAHRFLTPSRFCSFMWLWVIIATLIPTLIFRPWKAKD